MISRKITVVGAATVIALAFFCGPTVALSQEAAPDEANGYAGEEACLECHSEQAVAGPHTKITRDLALELFSDRALQGPHSAASNPNAPAAKNSCETCHGPGLKHAKFQEDNDDKDAVDPTLGTLRFGTQGHSTPSERNAVCMQCHIGGRQAFWDGSVHDVRDVSCIDCHSPHAKNQTYLRGANQFEVCGKCHKNVNAEIQQSSHHPLREGKMQCADCHNPHGTVADKLIEANDINEKCYECHAEKRGPFLWDHAPVQENCMSCHTPHGSRHDSLLTQKLPYLCQSCHSNSGHPGTLLALPASAEGQSPFIRLENRGFYRACMNCHSAVHGSNSPSGVSLAR